MSESTETGGDFAAPDVVVDPSGEGTPVQAETTAEAATADDDTAEDAGADQSKPKGGNGVQKRISELTAERRAEQREKEYWREMAMRGVPAQPTQQAQTPAALPPDLAQFVGAEPKPADYPAGEFDPAFIRAATKYDMKMEQASAALNQRAAQQQRAMGEFQQRTTSVVEEVSRMDPTIADVVTSQDFPMPQGVLNILMECDKPATVLAHLARNPDEAKRIAGLPSATAVARALDRIEQRIAATPAPRPSNAPPPPRTVRGGSGGAAPDLSRMSMEDYARHRSGG